MGKRVSILTTRVIYGDTDQMGIAYHSNYFRWFEMGRTQYLRDLGLTYLEIEKRGYYLPVAQAYCKYISPARYDDLIQIETTMGEIKKASLTFSYIIRNREKENPLVKGYTQHVFTDRDGKIKRIPPFVLEVLDKGVR